MLRNTSYSSSQNNQLSSVSFFSGNANCRQTISLAARREFVVAVVISVFVYVWDVGVFVLVDVVVVISVKQSKSYYRSTCSIVSRNGMASRHTFRSQLRQLFLCQALHVCLSYCLLAPSYVTRTSLASTTATTTKIVIDACNEMQSLLTSRHNAHKRSVTYRCTQRVPKHSMASILIFSCLTLSTNSLYVCVLDCVAVCLSVREFE